MNLADPRFDVPNKVDLLLGAEIYGQILMEGVLRGSPGTRAAQKMKLGWILSGLIHSKSSDYNDLETGPAVLTYNAVVQDDCILKKFWELEAEPSTTSSKKVLTEEEQMCEDIFQKTTNRDEAGRYVVILPFRTNEPNCKYGNLKDIASNCLYRLEQRLSKNPELMKQYSEVMKEYLDLNHMEIILINQVNKTGTVYLPHHAVVRNDKITTKVRVVYNASQKGINGVSLNNDLMVGPKLQPDLRHIIMRWRKHPICLSADIVKMYPQVKIAAEDTDYLRILWRDNDSRIQHYRMLRVTFGTSSAPYLAIKALQQLAHDEGHDYPKASEIVLRDFYVDDLLTGCETTDEALEIYKEINTLLNKGGFELQKWVTNSVEVLDSIGVGRTNKEKGVNIEIDKDVEDSRKVLGLNWKSIIDSFEYSVKLPEMEIPVTKRRVLSDISRLFNPLGSIAPVIITSKIFIQKLWLSGIEWDQELSSNLLSKWTNFRNELPKLTGHNTSRWIQKREDRSIDLQGFCDASNDAYGAVVYARVIDRHGNVYVHLIAAKTRVAPVKQVSIPRLELCGDLLLAKLLTEVAEVMEVPKDHVHAWTDSSIVLAWLSSHPGRWKIFVANRVSEIVTLLSRKHWSHVRSGENPADLDSRGMKPTDLINSSL